MHDADLEWHQARRDRAVQRLRAQRPPRLSDPGTLHPDIAAWAERLASGRAGNLLLLGPTGTGKTWSVWEALIHAAQAGYLGRIEFCASGRWREAIAPPVDRAALTRMRTADTLVLDDLGSGRVNEWELEQLLGIVDDRWANARPIVITTNAETLKPVVGERIASRLADGITTIALTGTDLRRTR